VRIIVAIALAVGSVVLASCHHGQIPSAQLLSPPPSTKLPSSAPSNAPPYGFRPASRPLWVWRRAYLESIKVGRCPLARLRLPTAEWVKPQLVAWVRHLAGAKNSHTPLKSLSSRPAKRPVSALRRSSLEGH